MLYNCFISKRILSKVTPGINLMKTPKQKFKSKINKIIIDLTNKGNHTAASQLYQTYFLYKKSI